MANKFKVGDDVVVNDPMVGKGIKGKVIIDNLTGRFPVLVKTDMNGEEICLQIPATESANVKLAKAPEAAEDNQRISYLFADGTATNWAKPERATAIRAGRAAVGAMKATVKNGVYSNHEFVSLVDKDDVVAAGKKAADDLLRKIFGF